MRKNKYCLCLSKGNGEYLMVNLIDKTCVELDEEVLEFVNNIDHLNLEELHNSYSEIINKLKIQGIIVEDDCNELEKLKTKEFEDLKNKIPSEFTLFEIITNWDCNLSCVYCFENKNKNNLLKERMNTEKIEKIFKFIDKYSEKNIQISLTGGEPLLLSNFPLIKKIFKEGSIRNAKFIITTNGMTLKYLPKFLTKYKDFIKSLRVTLDGTEKIHNRRRPTQGNGKSFSDIVEGIDSLLKRNFNKKITLITKIDEKNVCYIGDYIKFLKKKEWLKKLYISFGVVGNFGNRITENEKEKRKKLIKRILDFLNSNIDLFEYISFEDECNSVNLIKRLVLSGEFPIINYFGCSTFSVAGNIGGSFSPDGKFYPCISCAENKVFPIGEYMPEQRLYPENIKKLRSRNIFNLKQCQECSILPICGGTCPFRDMNKGDKDILNSVSCMAKDLMENEISEFFFKMRKQKEVNKDE